MNNFMEDYKSPYEELKKEKYWQIIADELEDLEKNNDIEITSHKDLVVGALVKRLKENILDK